MAPSSLASQIEQCSLARQFNNCRRMSQGAGVVDYRAVDEGHSAPGGLPTIAAVDMTENVQPRLNPEYSTEQILATGVFSHDVRFVERAVRRFVSDEHIRVVRDEIPGVPSENGQ